MAAFPNPALEAFIATFQDERVFGEVLIARAADQFQLRHVADRAAGDLKPVRVSDLRAISQQTSDGFFRPLRTAPTLQRGWHCTVRSASELDTALQHLYPGAMVDWFAAQQAAPQITGFHSFAQRQTGMYRGVTSLRGTELRQVVEICCSPGSCVRQRLWSEPELPPRPAVDKDSIPCLEPCAILLELARRAVLIAQEERLELRLAQSDADVIRAALRAAVMKQWPAVREADFASPAHPRRIQLTLARLEQLLPPTTSSERSNANVV